MTTDPIQRAFDGCAHEATTTQVRHTGTLQACDDCGQTWSFPATSQARGKDEIKSFVAASRDVAKAQRERDEARAERDENRASIESMHAHMDVLEAQRDRARQVATDLEAEVARLTHLLGSHADGHRCTCTLGSPAVYSGPAMQPAEWEQDPWCPTHPDMDFILSAKAALDRVRALADEWDREARRVVGPSSARLFAARILTALDGGDES